MNTGSASLSERLYEKLLRVYPPAHRRQYGPLMRQRFRDQYRDARRAGRGQQWRLWWRVGSELAQTAGGEHWEELKEAVMAKQSGRVGNESGRAVAMVLASVLIAGSLLGKSLIYEAGGSTELALAVLLSAHLVAGLIIDRVIEARGTAFLLMLMLVGATLLPLLWVPDGREWLRENPLLGGIFVVILAGSYQAGRPRWPLFVGAAVLGAAQILVSFI